MCEFFQATSSKVYCEHCVFNNDWARLLCYIHADERESDMFTMIWRACGVSQLRCVCAISWRRGGHLAVRVFTGAASCTVDDAKFLPVNTNVIVLCILDFYSAMSCVSGRTSVSSMNKPFVFCCIITRKILRDPG